MGITLFAACTVIHFSPSRSSRWAGFPDFCLNLSCPTHEGHHSSSGYQRHFKLTNGIQAGLWRMGRSAVFCLRNRFNLVIHSSVETHLSLNGFRSEEFFQGIYFVRKIFPVRGEEIVNKGVSLNSALDFVVCVDRVLPTARPEDTL